MKYLKAGPWNNNLIQFKDLPSKLYSKECSIVFGQNRTSLCFCRDLNYKNVTEW